MLMRHLRAFESLPGVARGRGGGGGRVDTRRFPRDRAVGRGIPRAESDDHRERAEERGSLSTATAEVDHQFASEEG